MCGSCWWIWREIVDGLPLLVEDLLLFEKLLQRIPAMLQSQCCAIKKGARKVRVAENGIPVFAVERHSQPQRVVLRARPQRACCLVYHRLHSGT